MKAWMVVALLAMVVTMVPPTASGTLHTQAGPCGPAYITDAQLGQVWLDVEVKVPGRVQILAWGKLDRTGMCLVLHVDRYRLLR